MSDIAICVQNLSKLYRIGAREAAYKTLREALTDAFTAPFRRRKNSKFETCTEPSRSIRSPNSDYIQALKNVCFEVKRSEVAGSSGGYP